MYCRVLFAYCIYIYIYCIPLAPSCCFVIITGVAGSEADEDVVTNGDLLLDAPNDLSKTEASTVIYPDAQKVIDPDVPEVTCPDISAMSTLPSDVAPLISPCAFTLPAGYGVLGLLCANERIVTLLLWVNIFYTL